MSSQRSEINVVVLGLDQLRELNTQQTRYNNLLQKGIGIAQAYAAAQQGMTAATSRAITINNSYDNSITNINKSTNSTINVMGQAQTASKGFLGSLMQYGAASRVLSLAARGVEDLARQWAELQKQQARISRVSTSGQMPVLTAGIGAEAARTGASLKDIGEGYYQLGTRIKDTNTLLAANRVAMNLVVGTEADSRDTTRLMIQLHEQFGTQLGKNITQAEQWRRVGELIAVSFKGADSETQELANALKYLGPIAEAARVPLEQMIGVVNALSGSGVRGRMAGTETGAFLTSIIKGYDTSQGGVARGDKLFKFDLAKTAEGGVDLYKTLENIVRIANSLPVEKGKEFLLGISGSQQAFRFLGTQGVHSMQEMREAIEQATKALKGQTNEAEKLKNQMMTTAQEGQRVFQGFFNFLSSMVDASPLRGFLHDVANQYEEINQRRLTAEQRSEQDRNALYHGTPYEQTRTQNNTVRTVLGVLASERQKYEAGGGNPNDFSQYANTALNRNPEYQALSDAQRNWWRTKFGVSGVPGEEIPTYTMEQFLHRGEARQSVLRSAEVAQRGKVNGLDPAFRTNVEELIAAAKAQGIDLAIGSGFRSHELQQRLFDQSDGSGRMVARPGHSQHEQGRAVDLVDANGTLINPNKHPNQKAAADFIAAHLGDYGLERPMGYEPWHLQPAGSGKVKGGIFDNKDKSGASDADTLFRDAQRDLMEKARGALDVMEHDFAGEGKTFQQFMKAASPYLATIDKAHLALAQKEGDQRYLANAKGGLTDSATYREKIQAVFEKEAEERQKARIEAIKKESETFSFLTDYAIKNFGVEDSRTAYFAKRAQDAAIRKAQANGDTDAVNRLRSGLTGPLPDLQGNLSTSRTERYKAYREDVQDGYDTQGALTQGTFDAAIRRKAQETDAALRALDMAQRPNLLQSDASRQSAEQAYLQGRVGIYQSGIANLGPETEDNKTALKEMRQNLDSANKALQDFKDQVQSSDFDKMLKRREEATTDAIAAVNNRTGPRGRETEQQKMTDALDKLARISAIRDAEVSDLLKLPSNAARDAALEQAQRAAGNARRDYQRYPGDYLNERYNSTYSQVQGQVVGAGMNFFKGKGGVGDLAKGIGDIVVNAAQEQFLKQFTDPLVQQITKEVLALEGLRVAVNTNTSALTGSPVDGASAPSSGAGGATGGAAGGTGRPSNADTAYANFAKYAGAGLGAYSIFSQGQQQGVTLGGVLGGAAAGAQIGSVIPGIGTGIGAVIGGGLDLLGGLFGGHHEDPLDTSKQKDPGLYNTPSDFEYQALRWHTLGRIPSAKELGMNLPNINAPVVNVYIGGVEQSVQKVLSNTTSAGSLNQTSHYYDMSRP